MLLFHKMIPCTPRVFVLYASEIEPFLPMCPKAFQAFIAYWYAQAQVQEQAQA